jgi:hypothetical protein
MKYRITERGFGCYEFTDRYDQPCSLQESSLAEESCVWFGTNDSRAHLTVDAVRELLPLLQHFVEHGRLPHGD